jgi:hypothetical protein
MAQRRPIIIDGEYSEVPSSARLLDVTPPNVQSVLTSDGQIISRADFARHPAPDGFETNLTPQVKG